MSSLLLSIIGVLAVSLTSLVGIFTLFFQKRAIDQILIFFVSFSAGSLIGSAFFHLLPESISGDLGVMNNFIFLVVGFCFFFAMEKILHWRHCHDDHCIEHNHLGWMNLVGGAIHNFIDGMIIFAAFQFGPFLGVPVTLSVFIHEIPHELGDFGVLVYSGFSRAKALFFNFVSSLVSLLGVLVAWLIISYNFSLESLILPFAAGGFIYIASADLVPELHKENGTMKSLATFLIFILAIILMYILKIING